MNFLYGILMVVNMKLLSFADARGQQYHTHTGNGNYVGPRGGTYTYNDKGIRKY